MGTMDQSAPNVGQASRLPAQAGSLRYMTGETPDYLSFSVHGNLPFAFAPALGP